METLAIGNLEYYKSVQTAVGHTLYVKNNADVVAAVAYYRAAGSKYVEMMAAPSYDPMTSVAMNNCVYSFSDGILLAYFNA